MSNKNTAIHIVGFVLIFAVIIASSIALMKISSLQDEVQDSDRIETVEVQVEELSDSVDALEVELEEEKAMPELEGPLTIDASSDDVEISVSKITLGKWLLDTYEFDSRLYTLGPSATDEDIAADIEELKTLLSTMRLECMTENAVSDEEVERYEDIATLYLAPYLTGEGNDDVYVYDVRYLSESQQPDTFRIMTVPNLAGISSIGDFEFSFNQCYAGGNAYPSSMNGEWLVFEASCGTGYADGSGLPVGCSEAAQAVEFSL